jgi:transcriptional regulator
MYQPPHFREDRIEVQHALIRAQSLGLLITAGRDGLQPNPVPFLIDADGSERGTLRAHLARGNPQWQELATVAECLVVFQGPHQYISPSLYPTKHEHGRVVPTWNYISVHAWGQPRVIDDAAWLIRQVDDLTSHKERSRSTPWFVSDAPESYVTAQLRGIIGIEVPIARIEGKWKVSQNRPAHDRAGVVAGLRDSGDDGETIASLVAERSRSGP